MPILKQIVITALFLAAGFWGLVTYVPTSLPILDRYGLLEPFGITVPETPAAAQGGGGRPSGGSRGPIQVIASEVASANIFNEIVTIGDGRALRNTTVVPEVSGRLSAINVQSSSYIEAGDVVATLEDRIQRLEVERAQFLLEDARAAANRVNALGTTVTAIQRSNAALALQTAELDLKEAEFELERRRIVAPISGWVGIINHNVGDQVSTATEITQIDDRSEIIVDFRVPERFVGQIKEGDAIRATALARPQDELIGTITALDSRVDADSRTLRLQASLANTDDVLRAGMAFRIIVDFTGESFPSIDPLAIQWGSDGPFVWVVDEGKAAQKAVMIMQRNSDSVLVSGELSVGDMVVTEGVQNLRSGAEVEIQVQATSNPAQAALPVSRG
ncbi:efflux RND transporter periplasmic adaptor subunit [Marivita sp.]|uniref:efflux RND transporter periplasmic adaptor subunit n=1 Tax=Marivita sp. TaxID=2003365 RepID=UPI003F6F4B83